MGKIVEGLWDCKYCDSKGIGGSKRECPHCGKPRDANTKFYMPGTITYVEKEKSKQISRKPDWICQFCDNLNPDTSNVCISCGASRTAENLNYFEKQNAKQTNDTEATIEEKPQTIPMLSEDEYIESDQSCEDENKKTTILGKIKSAISYTVRMVRNAIYDSLPAIGVIALIAVIIGSIVFLAIPRTRTVTVNHTFWDYSIDIERYQTVDESGWSLPSNARLHESKLEIYTYERVLDHYENKTRQVAKQRIDHYEERVVGYKDLGNGYFEEQTERVPVYETYYETEHYQEPVYRRQPVYKTKYYYEIDKWLHDRYLTTSGMDSEPYWADTSILKSDERTGQKTSKYTFSATDDKGSTEMYNISYSDWSDLNAGDEITMKVSVFGDVQSIEYNNKRE